MAHIGGLGPKRMSERFPPAKSPGVPHSSPRKSCASSCPSRRSRPRCRRLNARHSKSASPGSEDPVRTGSAGQKECLSVSHRAFAPRGCNAQHTQQQSYELMAQAAGKAEQGAELGCVYRKLKLGHNADAVHQGSRGNGYFQLVELGARKARPSLASDAFAIHYNRRWHTRLESGAGALRPV